MNGRNLLINLAVVLVILIVGVLVAIFSTPEEIDKSNFTVDEDGGYWVIEALLVPEEWKE